MAVTIKGSGQVPVQVISTTKTDTFSTTSTTFVDVTGLSVNITPTNSSNKVLVMVNLMASSILNQYNAFQLVRNSTALALGTPTRTYTYTAVNYPGDGLGNGLLSCSFQFLDSPNTTSSTTYKIQQLVTGGTGFVNGRSNDDTSVSSTITVMEISG